MYSIQTIKNHIKGAILAISLENRILELAFNMG